MLLTTLLYWFLVTISLLLFVCAHDRIVLTTHGLVSGKILKTLLKETEYYGFLGIPYAAPPIKDLRFLPPKNIDPWKNVLSTTKEKTPCVQFNQNIKKTQDTGQYGVEDCLYLDIFTPSTDNAKRAVIIFLYNEHFRYSYNKTKDYSPDFFIEEDVVISKISHRLSVFGFLSFEDNILPGNSGLKDIVMGLQWIKNNIESFGGDSNKITVMGLQGGAVAIDLLIHTKAKTLINAAILQSGTSLTPEFLQGNIKERALKLGNLLKISTSKSRLLQDLNEIPAEKLFANELKALPDDYYKENQSPLLTFGPIVEKDPKGLITDYPEFLQNPINIPIMIGSNSREGLDSSLPYLADPKYLVYLEKDFHFLLPIRRNFKFDPLKTEFYNAVNEIKKFYFKRGKVTTESISDYITYIGDVLISYPVDFMIRMYVKKNLNSTFYYHFDYNSVLNENKNSILKLSKAVDGTWGAASGDQLCYLFMCPSLKDYYIKLNQTIPEEFQLQKKLIKLWSNFAKYGNPTPKDNNPLQNIAWPKYNLNTKKYIHINENISVKSDLFKERFQFWETFLNKWQKLLNGSESETSKDEL